MAGLCDGSDLSAQSLSAQDNSSEKSDEIKIQSTEEEGGWPYEFVGIMDKEFDCVICLMPLRYPWLTECGHSMCRTCLDKMFLQENAFCPEDRNPISKENVFRDMRVHRKVMSLKVKCPYAEMEPYACKWIGELNDLTKKHLVFCGSEEVACTRDNCNDKLTRESFQSHIKEQCLWRERNCYYCLTPVVVCMLKNHEDVDCMEITVACSNSCDQQMPRKELNIHLEKNCVNRIVSCPFEDGGCKEKFAAGEIEKHLVDNIGRHLVVMYNKTKDQGQEMQMLKECNKDQAQEIKMLKESNIDQDRAKQERDRQVELLTEELKGSKRAIEMLKESNIDQDRAKQERDRQVELLTAELKGSKREIEMLKESNIDQDRAKQEQDRQINEIHRQLEIHRKQEIHRQQEIEKDRQINEIREQLEIKEIHRQLEIHKQEIENDKQKLQLRLNQFKKEVVSAFLTFASKNESKNTLGNVIDFLKAESIYDCQFMQNAWSHREDNKIVFIWFVNNFKLRQKLQMSNPVNDVESPEFCTGEKGYFMRAVFDPNGDGEGQGTHLSCGLERGKLGPYENKIKYPHDQLFRVTVINFKDRKEDMSVEKTFEVSKLSDIWRCYIFKMLDLRRVNDFILNDTIVLKISVNHYTTYY